MAQGDRAGREEQRGRSGSEPRARGPQGGSMRARRSRPGGFTRIELFVVIAISALLGAIFFPAHAQVPGADSLVIAPGAHLVKLAGTFVFTEGPAVDADGNVYFTDQPNDRILK